MTDLEGLARYHAGDEPTNVNFTREEAIAIRAAYGPIAEDWDDPSMDVYDAEAVTPDRIGTIEFNMEALRSRVVTLEADNAALKAAVARLEAIVDAMRERGEL